MTAVKLLLLIGLVHPIHSLVVDSNPKIVLIKDTADHDSIRRSFDPTDQDRATETARIMRNMTTDSAMRILEDNKQVPASLIASVQTVLASEARARKHGALRASSLGSQEPDVGTAQKMLNEMLYESMKKYDMEQAKCSNYYAKQCAEMESCRGEISAASGAAAACKAKTLSAQGEVELAQKELPKLSLSLKDHNTQCQKGINETQTHLARVMNDVAVMTTILKMTDCKATGFLQAKGVGILHCNTKCDTKSFVSFEDKVLRQKVKELETDQAHQALQDMFSDFTDSNSNLSSVIELLEDEVRQAPKKAPPMPKKAPPMTKTKVKPPPAPRTEKAVDPCEDPYAAPPTGGKRGAKCTMSNNPNCAKTQNRFLLIQAGMMDERDDLKDQLSDLEERCGDTHKTLNTQVESEETKLSDQQTKLADATSCESTASEKGRLVNTQYGELQSDMAKMQKSCQANFENLLVEQCGLKKVRGQVLKLSGSSVNIQDCQVGPWEPGQCSKECAGGTVNLTRQVMMSEQGGAGCLPTTMQRSCNDGPCPVDCKVGKWSKWSRCSAECGGGVAQRARDVEEHMKYGGKPCGQTSQAKPCNVQACEKDCVLKKWTKWTKCSKQCDGGTKRRTRFVKEPALGDGKCADEFDKTRLQYQPCNPQACKKAVRKGKPTLQCKSKLDVILVLDGSTDLGSTGWSKTIEAAKLFASAFQDDPDARVAVLTFSGPNSWSGVSKCMGEAKGPVNMETDCQVSWASKYTADMGELTATLGGLSWPKGGSLTSLALSTAENELQLARKDATKVVIVVTDGRPLSFRRTRIASERIKKSARLLWVPVSKLAPLAKFKEWASRRWQENVVQVSDYNKLATAETIDHIIANICPIVDGGTFVPAALASAGAKALGTNYDALCLDYNYNNQNVYMHKCHGEKNQRWYLDEEGHLKTTYDEKCLDYNFNDKNVYMNDCHGKKNQQWYLQGGRLKTKYDNKCLDYNYNNKNAYMHNCHGKKNQQWLWK